MTINAIVIIAKAVPVKLFTIAHPGEVPEGVILLRRQWAAVSIMVPLAFLLSVVGAIGA